MRTEELPQEACLSEGEPKIIGRSAAPSGNGCFHQCDGSNHCYKLQCDRGREVFVSRA